jgi:hypothetical protein
LPFSTASFAGMLAGKDRMKSAFESFVLFFAAIPAAPFRNVASLLPLQQRR